MCNIGVFIYYTHAHMSFDIYNSLLGGELLTPRKEISISAKKNVKMLSVEMENV